MLCLKGLHFGEASHLYTSKSLLLACAYYWCDYVIYVVHEVYDRLKPISTRKTVFKVSWHFLVFSSSRNVIYERLAIGYICGELETTS